MSQVPLNHNFILIITFGLIPIRDQALIFPLWNFEIFSKNLQKIFQNNVKIGDITNFFNIRGMAD